jgi:hypothetical protein
MQSQPDVSPSQKGLTRFASSKLLKIETAFWSRTKSKRRHSARFHLNPEIGGGERDRTDDLLLAKQALSQLSYTPDREIAGGSGWIRTNDPRLIKTVL